MASGYGLANAGDNFLKAFVGVSDVFRQREAQDNANALAKRQQQEFENTQSDRNEGRDVSRQLMDANTAYFNDQQGVPTQPLAAPMGPPTAGGEMSTQQAQVGVAPPGAEPRKTTLLEETKRAQAHFAKTAPLLARLAMLTNKEKGFEVADHLRKESTQNELAQEAAAGMMFIKDPFSNDARDAIAGIYVKHPDGYDIDKDTWKPTGQPGEVQFDVFNKDTGDRKTKTMNVTDARNLQRQLMAPDKINSALNEDLQRAEEAKRTKILEAGQADTAAYHKATVGLHGRQVELAAEEHRDARQARVDAAKLAAEAKVESARLSAENKKSLAKDEFSKAVMGPQGLLDPKFRDQLEQERPDEIPRRNGIVQDTFALAEYNPEAFSEKSQQSGHRALSIIQAIGEGRVKPADIGTDDSQPGITFIRFGNTVYRLPSSASVLTRPQTPPKKK